MANTTINSLVFHNGTDTVMNENDLRKESNLSVLPLYLSDSDATDVFDFGGVTKTINLSGVYIADTVAALKTWIDARESLQQGHQDVAAGAPYTMVDDLRGTIKVKVLSFSSTFVEGNPTQITWTIKLVESSTNA